MANRKACTNFKHLIHCLQSVHPFIFHKQAFLLIHMPCTHLTLTTEYGMGHYCPGNRLEAVMYYFTTALHVISTMKLNHHQQDLNLVALKELEHS